MTLQLRDYLDLDVNSARRQWLSLRARVEPLPGQRQVDFLPIETLTCFGLGLIAPPSPSGTINLRRTDPVVQLFARLFRRSEKSLAAKLNNLDGRREHAARYEAELWVELTWGTEVFPALYATILQGAREAGYGPDEVPDYLDMDGDVFQLVAGASDVTVSQLEDAMRDQLGEQDVDRLTERAVIGTVRVGQQQFARRVLANSDYSCAFCGLNTRKHGIKSSRLLVASHVKPWREASSAERVNPLNGLAACPTHDAAFENYLIRVDTEGRVFRSAEVESAIERDPVWARYFGPETLSSRLLVVDEAVLPGRTFVDWHWSEAQRLEIEYLE